MAGGGSGTRSKRSARLPRIRSVVGRRVLGRARDVRDGVHRLVQRPHGRLPRFGKAGAGSGHGLRPGAGGWSRCRAVHDPGAGDRRSTRDRSRLRRALDWCKGRSGTASRFPGRARPCGRGGLVAVVRPAASSAVDRLRVIVAGMVAGDPFQGGASWAVLQYVEGLRRMGHDVVFVEPVRREALRPGAGEPTRNAFTTIGNWRSYGSIEHRGVEYGQRAHSFRRLFDLPRLTAATFEPALAIHRDEERDLRALREHGWHLVDSVDVAG